MHACTHQCGLHLLALGAKVVELVLELTSTRLVNFLQLQTLNMSDALTSKRMRCISIINTTPPLGTPHQVRNAFHRHKAGLAAP